MDFDPKTPISFRAALNYDRLGLVAPAAGRMMASGVVKASFSCVSLYRSRRL
jgi:hypothetical protein